MVHDYRVSAFASSLSMILNERCVLTQPNMVDFHTRFLISVGWSESVFIILIYEQVGIDLLVASSLASLDLLAHKCTVQKVCFLSCFHQLSSPPLLILVLFPSVTYQ